MSKESNRISGPGFATISDLARRWQVSRDRVPEIAQMLGLQQSAYSERPRYSWRSAWAAEGLGQPGRHHWDAAKRKVYLTPAQVAAALQLKGRTIRERRQRRTIPCLALGPRTHRFDPVVIERMRGDV